MLSLTPQNNKHPERKLHICIFEEKLEADKKNLSTHDVAGGLSAIVCGVLPPFCTITLSPGPCLGGSW